MAKIAPKTTGTRTERTGYPAVNTILAASLFCIMIPISAQMDATAPNNVPTVERAPAVAAIVLPPQKTGEKPLAQIPANTKIETPGVTTATQQPAQKPPEDIPATPISELENKWGIKILAARRTAANCMIDLRYRVLDPEKAAPLLDSRLNPYLVDEQSKNTLPVPVPPKVGPLRNTKNCKANTNYFLMFANPCGLLKKGSLVSVVIGDMKVEHIAIE